MIRKKEPGRQGQSHHAGAGRRPYGRGLSHSGRRSRRLPNWQSCPKPLSRVMPRPPLDSETLEANLEMTLREWIERYQQKLVFEHVHYRGVPTWKNVLDLWVYQEIIWQTGVEIVIEIGA